MPVPLRPDHLRFALRLHTELTATAASSGLVWSPYSLACALGLLAHGARGETRAELTRLLGEDVEGHLYALDDTVAQGPELAANTGLWVRSDLPVRPEFAAALHGRPGSGLYTADFPGDPEGVRRAVNTEVAETTRGLITELLQPGQVEARTQALLVNALWVRLHWSTPFDVARTARTKFHAPAGTRRVPMMHRRGRISYAQAHGWRMATLEGDHDLALDVLLPDQGASGTGPAPDTLTALYREAAPTDVELALPRFELTHRSELSTALSDAGVRTVFTSAADLGDISARPLLVDDVVHQARLRVDEKGAEGAAATAVVMRLAALVPDTPVVFTADRPFTIVLRRREAVLFLGVITDPQDPGPGA